MSYDIVVVGGGIGGLTVAALASTRGMSVCLLERQSQVGGCVGKIEFAGHNFEPGMGLYPGWGEGEVHQRVCAELPVASIEVAKLNSEYVVRLEDQTDVHLHKEDSAFFAELQRAFPECGDQAVEFYRTAQRITDAWQGRSEADGFAKRLRSFLSNSGLSTELRDASERATIEYAAKTSIRFQRFIDAQLRAFCHSSIERAAFLPACLALTTPRRNLFVLNGGPAALAERLSAAITRSGGRVRLDSPVLRLASDESGQAVGVDLLSGETILAKRAIVSNLTIWDTYGKLIGLNRTPTEIKKAISNKRASGAFVVYASMERAAMNRLPTSLLLCAPRSVDDETNTGELTFVAPDPSYLTAPPGKRAVTIKTRCDVDDWFTFQSSNEEYEQWDQAALEMVWTKLHLCMPELGSDIEVIETSNPRTCYDLTRRKLGMVLGVEPTPEQILKESHGTSVPNLFMVGDTVATAATLESVTQAALNLTNLLTGHTK